MIFSGLGNGLWKIVNAKLPNKPKPSVTSHVAPSAENDNVFWFIVQGVSVFVVPLTPTTSALNAWSNLRIKPFRPSSPSPLTGLVSFPVWMLWSKPLSFGNVFR